MSTTTVNPTASGVRSTGTLFDPLQLGRYSLRHRILMAPLTRSRARQPGNVPTSLMACYYAQRASAALIISEATQVSMQGQGYAWTPGIHSRDQVLYHLEERAVEHAVLPWCERHNSALVAYSPFGHGRFPDARTSGGRHG